MLARDREPRGARRVDARRVHRVGELGEREVDDARDRARGDQPLHRPARPRRWRGTPPARARLLEPRQHPHHGRRRVAEHRDPDAVLAELLDRPARVARHADHSRRGVVEHRRRDRVEAEDVGDRVHCERVGLAHEGPERAPPRTRSATRSASARPPAGRRRRRRRAGPPRHRRGRARRRSARSSQSRSTTARTPRLHQLHRRAARARATHLRPARSCRRGRPRRATRRASQPDGSPRMPESITTASRRRARAMRSRTYATSSPFVSRVRYQRDLRRFAQTA